MSEPDAPNDSESNPSGGKQSGSQVLIGFCVIVLVLLAVGLNNADRVAELGHRLLGWTTPKEQCIHNLKQIDAAAQEWALMLAFEKKVSVSTYTLSDTSVLRYLKGSALPLCPLGGKYTAATNLLDSPRCSIPGHTL